MIPRRLKRVLLAALSIVVLTVVAVELISWNFLKPRIASWVESATGRELSLEGDVALSLLPRPRITLNDVSLANPAWTASDHFVELERLRVAPDLSALLTGRLALARIDVDAPVIRLIERAEGAPNWVLDGGNQQEPSNDEPVPVHRLHLTDAEILYQQAAGGEALQARIPSLRLRDDGQISEAQATVLFRDRAFELQARTDSVFSRNGASDTFDAELRLSGAGTDLEAELAVNTGGEVPELKGSIRSEAIDLAVLPGGLRSKEGAETGPATLPLPPVLPRLAGRVAIDVGWIAGLGVPIEKASGQLRFDRHRLTVENVEIVAAGTALQGSARLSSSPEAVSGAMKLSAPEVPLEQGEGASPTLAGDFDIRLEPVPRQQWAREVVVRRLGVEAAYIEYANAPEETRLSASARLTEDGARPVVEFSAKLAGRPLEGRIEGDALANGWPGENFGLKGRATSNGLALSVDTSLGSVRRFNHFDGRVSLAGDGVESLQAWVGRELPETPPFELAGRLSRDRGLWKAEELALSMADSRLGGDVQVNMDGRPRISAALEAEVLDLAWLQGGSGEGASSTSAGARNPDLSWLRGFDADLELDAARVALAEGVAFREAVLRAALENAKLDLERFETGVADGSFSLSGRLDAGDVPASAHIESQFEDIALGRLADTFSPLEERLGRLSGNVQVIVTQTLDEAFREDILAPMIGRLKIEPSELRFSDPSAGTDLQLSARTEGLSADDQRFRLQGSGRYDGDPVDLDLRSDRLLDIRLPGRPYAVDLDARIVDTLIELDGTLMRPLATEGLDLRLAFEGPNPQRLSRLLGVPLPALPTYDVSGQLALERGRWSLSALEGRVGDSDLSGRLAFDADTSPPSLTGDLRSDSLDIDDLAGIAGAEPETGEAEAGSTQQKRETQREGEDRFVLPDDPLLGEAWGRVDADIRYRGKSVRAGDVPLSDLAIDFSLTDGHARFQPVVFGVGEGDVDLSLDLDASLQPPEGTMEIEVRGVDLRKALSHWQLADDSVGLIGAQGKFWVTGASLAELFGSADGGLVMLMTEGRLEALLVELAGLDAGQSFLTWLGGAEGFDINCAYVDLQARDGVARLDTFVVDTEDTVFTAGGQVNLDDERLDISVVAHPQDASVLVVRTPFHLGGTFNDIETGIHAGELGLRVAGSAGLAALGGPLAAALPLLETGRDERVGYCEGLTERTRRAIENAEDDS